MFPPDALRSVAIYHLPTTAGQTQSYPGTADVTVPGAFLPMSRYMHALEGGNYVNPFDLFLPTSVDIRIGDKVVVSGTNYYVKKVDTHYFGILKHIRASLATQP